MLLKHLHPYKGSWEILSQRLYFILTTAFICLVLCKHLGSRLEMIIFSIVDKGNNSYINTINGVYKLLDILKMHCLVYAKYILINKWNWNIINVPFINWGVAHTDTVLFNQVLIRQWYGSTKFSQFFSLASSSHSCLDLGHLSTASMCVALHEEMVEQDPSYIYMYIYENEETKSK